MGHGITRISNVTCILGVTKSPCRRQLIWPSHDITGISNESVMPRIFYAWHDWHVVASASLCLSLGIQTISTETYILSVVWWAAHFCVRLARAVCCSVLQCVAVCCSALQCVAVYCSVLQCVAVCCSVLQRVAVCCGVLQCVTLCCNVSWAC